jgi:hypothetical protein
MARQAEKLQKGLGNVEQAADDSMAETRKGR